jgi:hypothetical protein
MEFTGGMELATPAEKAVAGLVEKATMGPCAGEGHGGGRRSGEGGSPDVALGRGGDVGWRSRGAMERERRSGEHSHRGSATDHGRGALSLRCGEMSF